MKRILITGANSYIGVSVEKWLNQWKDKYEVNTLDMQSEEWCQHDFSKYDSVFHVAGIAHADVGNVSEETKQLYYKVNTELTETTAQKAKEAGVKQFIFMSSIIVYGDSQSVRKKRIITRETPLAPANFYGDSKAKAEERLKSLIDETFKVVILRIKSPLNLFYFLKQLHFQKLHLIKDDYVYQDISPQQHILLLVK